MSTYKYIEDSRSRTADALVALENSTSALLLANQTFTGSIDDVFAYSSIAVNVFADEVGTLEIRQSSNGTNWDLVKTFPVLGGRGEHHAAVVSSRYAQIRYVNGAEDQGSFRLQTIYHMYKAIETSKVSSSSIVDEDSDAQLVRIMNDADFDLITGRYLSRKQVKVFGYSYRIRTTIQEMIRDESLGVADQVLLTTATTVRVKAGGSLNDIDTTGTGARQISVYGLDENFDPVAETIALAGASASAVTTATFIRVFGAKITSCGAYAGKASGDINIETSGGVQMCRIRAGSSSSKKASYCVPAGKTCYIKSVNAHVPSDKLGWADLYIREGANITTAPFKPINSALKWQVQGTANEINNLEYAIICPEKTDIWVAMISEGGDINDANCSFTMLEVDNVV